MTLRRSLSQRITAFENLNSKKSNTFNSSIAEKDELTNLINISIISTNSKVGKSMLTDLLRQTGFIDRSTFLSNAEFTVLCDKSIIVRKIPSAQIRANDTNTRQWINDSDIVILVVRESLTSEDRQLASARYLSEKKTLFVVRTYINETVRNAQQNCQTSYDEQETLKETKTFTWLSLKDYLICENDIYLIGSCFDDTEKWDFLRLKDNILKKCIDIREEQIKKSKAEAGRYMLDTEKQLLEKYFGQFGLEGIDQYLISRLRKWEQCALNIAVTGHSGVGKSSFINAIRGVTRNSEYFAPTGCTECTDEPKDYPHPEHKNIIFWDLPGCGTPKYPQDTYLNKIGFEKYDAVIIICRGRFSENDDWLATKMTEMKKPFFFIRSQIDTDIKNERRDCPSPFDEDEVLTRIRNDCLKQLGSRARNQKVYLISGKHEHLDKWDMNDFMHDLCEGCPQLKRESLVFSMNANCREAVRAKIQYLRERKWLLASASAAAAILPIPGFSMSVNVLFCMAEAKECRQQLGLHNEAVERLAVLKSTSSEYIRDTINSILPILDDNIFENNIKEHLVTISAALGHCVPVMGCVYSLTSITQTLDYFLTLMEKAALTVIDIHFCDISSLTSTTDSEDDEVE